MALPEELGSSSISSTCSPARMGELPHPNAVNDCEIIRAMTGLAMGRIADCRRMESIERWAASRSQNGNPTIAYSGRSPARETSLNRRPGSGREHSWRSCRDELAKRHNRAGQRTRRFLGKAGCPRFRVRLSYTCRPVSVWDRRCRLVARKAMIPISPVAATKTSPGKRLICSPGSWAVQTKNFLAMGGPSSGEQVKLGLAPELNRVDREKFHSCTGETARRPN